MQVRASTPDDMTRDGKTSQQRQKLNAWDNSAGTESLEGADARDGQTVQAASNSVQWSKRLEAHSDAMEAKLGGMKIKETLEVGSPVVIIEAPPMLKTAEPMPMTRPNTGIIKPGDTGRYFFPNICDSEFSFPVERTLLSFNGASWFAKPQCVLLQNKMQFCSNQDLLSLQDYW